MTSRTKGSDAIRGEPARPPWVLLGAAIPADEYKQAGVTWLVEGIYPEGGWIDELRASIRRGPRN